MNYLLRLSFCALLAIALLPGCTQNDDPDPQAPPASGLYGTLSVNRMIYALTIHSDTSDAVEAIFRASLTDSTGVPAGIVMYNTDTLPGDTLEEIGYIYGFGGNAGEGTLLPGGAPSQWSVTGSVNVPAFSYTHAGPRPDYTIPFPDTISKSAGLSYNLSAALTGAKYFRLYLTDGVHILDTTLTVSNGVLNLTPQALQDFIATPYVPAIIYAWDIAYETFSGKQYQFVKRLTISKYITLSN